MGYWSRLYSRLDKLLMRVPFVDPDKLSWIGVFLSLFSIFLSSNSLYFSILIFVVLLFDYLDGVMARRAKKRDEHIDLACDRASELVILTSFNPWLLIPVVLNVWISAYKLKKKIDMPIVLPLRVILLIYLILRMVL